MPELSETRIAELAGRLDGPVLLPGSAGYAARHAPAIARFAQPRPRAIVCCRSTADVVRTVDFARRHGLPVTTRAGGHDFAGRSSTAGLLVQLRELRAVEVSGAVATIGAGATLGEVYRGLGAATLPAGCGPTVGIAGLTLGGGLGILGRQYGLTCDRLLRARIVLADGSVLDCSAEREPELFWALRGAGAGQFGVVTELVFAAVPAPRRTVFEYTWEYRHAAGLVAAWQAAAPDAPAAVAASLLLHAPADPARPPTVTLFGTATAATVHTVLDACTAVAAPRTGFRTELPVAAAKRLLAQRAPGAGAGDPYHHSEFFRQSLPGAAIAELVGMFTAARVPGEARELDFTPWGGAYHDVPETGTAFPHRAERFLLKHTAVRTAGAPATTWLRRSWQAVRPYGSGGVYPNFPDPSLADPGRAYYRGNLDRVLAARAAYDPAGVFPAAFRTAPVTADPCRPGSAAAGRPR